MPSFVIATFEGRRVGWTPLILCCLVRLVICVHENFNVDGDGQMFIAPMTLSPLCEVIHKATGRTVRCRSARIGAEVGD